MIKKIICKLFNVHPDAMSFEETLNLTGLPIISLKQWNSENQEDRVFNFILDTGSDLNLIDKNILDRIEYEDTNIKGFTYGVEGNSVESSAVNITFKHKERDYPYLWVLRDLSKPFGSMKRDYGVNLHGIIGSGFFNKYKYILDFKELKAYSKE